MRQLRMTPRRWIVVVLCVAAILALRNELASIRRQQIDAGLERLARALAESRHEHGSG